MSTPSATAQTPAECNGLPVTILGTDGNDDLVGTDGDDVISLLDGDDIVSSGAGNDTICDGAGGVTIDAGDGDDIVISGAGSEFKPSGIRMGSGNDTVTLLTGGSAATHVYLGPGADIIDVLGSGDHWILGEEGDDIILGKAGPWSGYTGFFGGPGNDRIVGNNVGGDGGNDHITAVGRRASISGGNGNDRIIGTAWDDQLRGGEGHDVLIGRGGDDMLDGWTGDDLLIGGSGTDTLVGGNGDDTLKGGSRRDHIRGGRGFDEIYGGSGNDIITDYWQGATIRGGKGSDTITITNEKVRSSVAGGPGADFITADGFLLEIHGDGGPDTFTVRLGESTVYGDAGHDEIVFKARAEGLSFNLGSGDDVLVEKPGVRHMTGIEVSGGPGNDFVMGTQFPDTLRGNSGSDFIDGREADDVIEGGKDPDTLAGGLGADVVRGGGDTDRCLLGHWDLVDFRQPGVIYAWEGPPDAGDVGDCEETWGATGYWTYSGGPVFEPDVANAAYHASAISVDVYGLDADLHPASATEVGASDRRAPQDRFDR